MYLTGTYQHTMDAKSRLTLPANFRKQFDDVVCLVPVGNSLRGFTPEAHEAWVMSLFPEGMDSRNPEDDKLLRKVTSRTTTVEIDSAGRVCLGKVPEKRRSVLGDERELTVVGVADHFEIWATPTWDATQAEADDEDIADLIFGA